MLQIVIESQEIEVGKDNGRAFADFFIEDGYLTCAVDLRDYKGPLAPWAKDAVVVVCYPEDIANIFRDDSAEGYGCRVFDWAGYCKYMNTNVAA